MKTTLILLSCIACLTIGFLFDAKVMQPQPEQIKALCDALVDSTRISDSCQSAKSLSHLDSLFNDMNWLVESMDTMCNEKQARIDFLLHKDSLRGIDNFCNYNVFNKSKYICTLNK